MATEEDDEPFGIGVTLACRQQSGKLPTQTRSRNTTLRRGAIISAFSLEKEETYPMGQCHHKDQSLTRDALTSVDLKAKVIRLGDRWQFSGRSTDSLDFLLSKAHLH